MSWFQHLYQTPSREMEGRQKVRAGLGGMCQWGWKLGFLATLIFLLDTQVIPQERPEPLVCPHCSSDFNHVTFFLGLSPLHFYKMWTGNHSLTHFPASLSEGPFFFFFFWKQRPASHGLCHPDPQLGHGCGHYRQATWTSGPALPPALKGFPS